MTEPSKLTPVEQAMAWERGSGRRLSMAERNRIMSGGEFSPPTYPCPKDLMDAFQDGQPPWNIRPRHETPEIKIIEALRHYTNRSGAQLAALTKLGSSDLYPALMALEGEGIITSYWEEMKSPRRRRYRLAEESAGG